MSAAKYKVLGVNDDMNSCACCGKQNLKKVVWLVQLDLDGCEIREPVHYGVICASKLMGYNYTRAKAEVKLSHLAAETAKETAWKFEQESNIINRISSNKDYANMLFWKTHVCIDPIPTTETFFMHNQGDFVRVWIKEPDYVEILKRYGFEKYN